MRHYIVDPDNDQRLLKIPTEIVAAIKEEAFMDSMDAIDALRKGSDG
jgi:hypothetical protein